MARVDIALATFDGGSFVGEQVESIIAQTHPEWQLIARDDGSTDDTVAVLERYRDAEPERIVIVADGDGTLGHVGNFARVLGHSTAPYVALCDQDDVWLPGKLAASLAALQRLERRVGSDTPCLVFTDATVVDAGLRPLAPSFWARTGVRPTDADDLGRMLYGNVVAGHTAIINAPLRDLALPVPDTVRFIDWWITLLAAACGETTFLPEPTVLHRQHGHNVNGARPRRRISMREGLDQLRRRDEIAQHRARRFGQAEALRERTAGLLDEESTRVLDGFLSLPSVGLVERVRRARRHGLMPRDLVRAAIFVATAPRWPAGSGRRVGRHPGGGQPR